MAEAYIVEALRTAGGRRGGKLAGWHPADMAGEVLSALVERSGIDPAAVEDVVMGCVSQAGEQSQPPAYTAESTQAGTGRRPGPRPTSSKPCARPGAAAAAGSPPGTPPTWRARC